MVELYDIGFCLHQVHYWMDDSCQQKQEERDERVSLVVITVLRPVLYLGD